MLIFFCNPLLPRGRVAEKTLQLGEDSLCLTLCLFAVPMTKRTCAVMKAALQMRERWLSLPAFCRLAFWEVEGSLMVWGSSLSFHALFLCARTEKEYLWFRFYWCFAPYIHNRSCYIDFCEAFTSTHCYVGSTNMRLWTQEHKPLWVIPVQWQYSSE